MTPEAADELGKRIINCWRGGPPLAEWKTELQRLDEGQAGTAYARLKRSLEHAPSIARFIAEYNALNVHDGGNRESACRWCGGSGWLPQLNSFTLGRNVYSGVEPCSECPAGKAQEGSRTWQESKPRDFITDTEADRLIRALKETA